MGIQRFAAINKARGKVEQIGSCVYCRAGIFSNQEWGRAPRPLIGKAHAWCGGVR